MTRAIGESWIEGGYLHEMTEQGVQSMAPDVGEPERSEILDAWLGERRRDYGARARPTSGPAFALPCARRPEYPADPLCPCETCRRTVADDLAAVVAEMREAVEGGTPPRAGRRRGCGLPAVAARRGRARR
jgi:hypothetical protein